MITSEISRAFELIKQLLDGNLDPSSGVSQLRQLIRSDAFPDDGNPIASRLRDLAYDLALYSPDANAHRNALFGPERAMQEMRAALQEAEATRDIRPS